MSPAFYSVAQISRLLRLKPGQLRRWQRQGLFPMRQRLSWNDMQRAQVLARCSARIPNRRLRQCIAAASTRIPGVTDPWLEASFAVFAGRLEVRHRGLVIDALSGQLHLPFGDSIAVVKRDAVSSLDDPEQWFKFALSMEGMPEMRLQAAAAYERCLEIDPGFTSAHINLGTLRYHEKNFAAAEACYRAAMKADPNYALAHFNLGNVLDETGRMAEAIVEYCQAVKLAPGYADAHYNLALAYQRQGLHRKAVPHWQQYLGLDKQSPWALHARTQLRQTLQRDGLKLLSRAGTNAR